MPVVLTLKQRFITVYGPQHVVLRKVYCVFKIHNNSGTIANRIVAHAYINRFN